ncbi:GM19184 [Drosophila sechellia]|uniref:GM19184 n=1 Tax=Drosophila sechellia TaxID=7238 RepID=B4I9M0_DROSE|nr:GM19184 [Drosophila sechellia]
MSKSAVEQPIHFHLSETPELSASTSLLPSAFVASSAALVNVTCQAEEGQSSAGSHYTVHRGNDAGISFAALDFRFISFSGQWLKCGDIGRNG